MCESGQQRGRYVPLALRSRLDHVPEGTQANDNSQQPQQYASRRDGGYSKRGGRGGNRGGGGQRPQYAGRFSYDQSFQSNVYDEKQWAQSNQQNSRWARLDEPDRHFDGGSFNRGGTGTPATWQRQHPPDPNLEAELFTGMSSGINTDKYEEIPIEATGENCPAPINSFADIELHEWIQENIIKCGYDRPTPVQKYSIPTLNSKRDLMSCAQTGSGKTAAFLIPVINQILKAGPSIVRRGETQRSGKTVQFPLALIVLIFQFIYKPPEGLAIQKI
uniref:ATP-dependent RNA helicase n=1 Tax=Panagrolaimus sp. JU765 TaxID=591449 RepID=A0AC34QU62_9BILA